MNTFAEKWFNFLRKSIIVFVMSCFVIFGYVCLGSFKVLLNSWLWVVVWCHFDMCAKFFQGVLLFFIMSFNSFLCAYEYCGSLTCRWFHHPLKVLRKVEMAKSVSVKMKYVKLLSSVGKGSKQIHLVEKVLSQIRWKRLLCQGLVYRSTTPEQRRAVTSAFVTTARRSSHVQQNQEPPTFRSICKSAESTSPTWSVMEKIKLSSMTKAVWRHQTCLSRFSEKPQMSYSC